MNLFSRILAAARKRTVTPLLQVVTRCSGRRLSPDAPCLAAPPLAGHNDMRKSDGCPVLLPKVVTFPTAPYPPDDMNSSSPAAARQCMIRRLGACLLLLLLAGCSLVQTFNALIPTADIECIDNLTYGPLPRQRLDLYRPAGESRGLRPVVVFFYGGSWDSGRKEDYLFVAEALTSIGVIAVLPDYRVYPEVRFPAFLDDAGAAVAWSRRHVSDYGGDPDRLFVMGHSAGAHIAAMLAFDRQWLRKAGSDPGQLAGFIGLAGPYDFLPLKSERLKTIFGPEPSRMLSQPIHFVTREAPPALLLHGDADTVVGPHNSANLARRIRELGGRVDYIRYPGLDHQTIVVNLSALFRAGKPELPAIAAFIGKTASGTGRSPLLPSQAAGATP